MHETDMPSLYTVVPRRKREGYVVECQFEATSAIILFANLHTLLPLLYKRTGKQTKPGEHRLTGRRS